MTGLEGLKNILTLYTHIYIYRFMRDVPLLPGHGNKANPENFLKGFFSYSSTVFKLFQHSRH